MSEVFGYKTKHVYFHGTKPDCMKYINGLKKIVRSQKTKKGSEVFGFDEPLLVRKVVEE
ncbi:hypothetical protein J3326_01315 [Leuconostoc mesenteroides]|uniref:hypothetical protein n=1 Tax=Leuconostoc mesenteroides TaxID=1245 RepID=UPI001CBD9679|nr:hypothetical protein [Leuconostoc mesenteroides]MBZ1515826.1 hypothetical protein [Leuconostoc mesenteroides]